MRCRSNVIPVETERDLHMTKYSRAERRHFIPTNVCQKFLSHGALTQFKGPIGQIEPNIVIPHKYPRPGVDWSIFQT